MAAAPDAAYEMQTFESRLRKANFFKKIEELNIENVLLVDDRYTNREEQRATGFIIDDIWVGIFLGPEESVWVALGHSKGKSDKKSELIEHLQLAMKESYPYVLDNPSKEVMEIWKKKSSQN